MSAKNKLESLKAAFDKKSGGAAATSDQSWKKFFQFWKMPDDSTATVRFLPDLDQDNNLGFLVEKLEHELIINGKREKVPCLAMHGEDCPICAMSRKYYDEKNDEMGKKYYRKKSYVGQVIVVDSPIEHDQSQLVKLIEFGPALFKQIQAAFQSGDLEEAPYELKGGYNFRIKKTKNGQYASYTTSSFAPKQTDLDDDVIDQLQLFNLADYRGKKRDVATVQALLMAEQTGQQLEDDIDESPAVVETVVAAKPVAAKPAVAPAKPKQAAVEQEDEPAAKPAVSSKASSVLEQLRARAKAQQSTAE